MKKVLILLLLIFSSMAVFSSDLIIDSKTQTFSDKEKKIKLDGGVKVKLDNLTVESDRADVTIRRNNKLDTATFYDKPYAYEVNENKKQISDSMMMLIVLNTTSVELIPTTVIAIRQSLNAQNPASIIIPIWISTIVGTMVGIISTKLLIKRDSKK